MTAIGVSANGVMAGDIDNNGQIDALDLAKFDEILATDLSEGLAELNTLLGGTSYSTEQLNILLNLDGKTGITNADKNLLSTYIDDHAAPPEFSQEWFIQLNAILGVDTDVLADGPITYAGFVGDTDSPSITEEAFNMMFGTDGEIDDIAELIAGINIINEAVEAGAFGAESLANVASLYFEADNFVQVDIDDILTNANYQEIRDYATAEGYVLTTDGVWAMIQALITSGDIVPVDTVIDEDTVPEVNLNSLNTFATTSNNNRNLAISLQSGLATIGINTSITEAMVVGGLTYGELNTTIMTESAFNTYWSDGKIDSAEDLNDGITAMNTMMAGWGTSSVFTPSATDYTRLLSSANLVAMDLSDILDGSTVTSGANKEIMQYMDANGYTADLDSVWEMIQDLGPAVYRNGSVDMDKLLTETERINDISPEFDVEDTFESAGAFISSALAAAGTRGNALSYSELCDAHESCQLTGDNATLARWLYDYGDRSRFNEYTGGNSLNATDLNSGVFI